MAARFDFADDFAIDRGTTWQVSFGAVDQAGAAWDVSAYTAKLQFRPGRVTDDGRAFLSAPPTLTLTHASGITLGVGTITITLTPTQTRALYDGPQAYDLRLYSGSNEYRPLFGAVVALPEVTVYP